MEERVSSLMLIHNATLWDGTGAAARRHTSLRIEGDRLAWIGPDAQAPAGESGEPVVDAGGRHVLPGLVDLHVHLTADTAQPDFVRYFLTTSIAEQTLVGAQHSRLMLEAGFTATRDLGAVGFANVALKRAIDAGRIPGPRVAACGSFLTVPGGHGDNT
ncbi:MAG TPA: amidohydrolase family protein, partial [Chloroflexota bacterium]|nr:amidohydrolase family protein [Chloroflexota bacterium]